MAGNVALIVAAGRGERMGDPASGPKQYRDLGGRAVLAWSVRAFCSHAAIDHVLVAIHRDDRERYDTALTGFVTNAKLLEPVIGGATRQQSVLAGLETLARLAPDKVAIHDAARPFVSEELIDAMLEAADAQAGAVPGHAVTDTLKHTDSDGVVSGTVARDGLFAVQTPQVFGFDAILAAHRNAATERTGLTDDAAVAEHAGLRVVVVPHEGENMKITTPGDLDAARAGLTDRLPDVRTGNGYDVHQTCDGDHVTLCGLRIAHDRGLSGHSDADVGLHALTDALLATVADGDIGSHFPPSDPQWKGASSDRFLAHAVGLVRAAGGTITNLDVTLICEAPKIGPHRDAMRARIAEIAGVLVGRISVKATTNETIGFIGRREGIAAIATATAVFDPALERNGET
ncbi:MAG: bifunctional 2-C-methyl-D-erythritol 4-phosphate cytidylyltransferase/2-C-methyl-D-erythritol 2,4-cyclodiphosphate synthase [Hyphomicrobiales bacterium]|nr:bifunctional 2-C-methyl-D-erythritol 4-phosphate cytidylyltransferase/2-C-methyl-D-erythritol 2,4-cyclodiphosphate synthase [Hyphomicrobiales bacterium]